MVDFDDSFRKVQGLYGVPWVNESHHLHSVKLVPLALADTNFNRKWSRPVSHSYSADSNLTSDGKTIYRKFNNPYGCDLSLCRYLHVCNLKLSSGKACGYPSYKHEQS